MWESERRPELGQKIRSVIINGRRIVYHNKLSDVEVRRKFETKRGKGVPVLS